MKVGDLVRAIDNKEVIGPIIRGGFSGGMRYWWLFDGGNTLLHEEGCVMYFEQDLEVVCRQVI